MFFRNNVKKIIIIQPIPTYIPTVSSTMQYMAIYNYIILIIKYRVVEIGYESFVNVDAINIEPQTLRRSTKRFFFMFRLKQSQLTMG